MPLSSIMMKELFSVDLKGMEMFYPSIQDMKTNQSLFPIIHFSKPENVAKIIKKRYFLDFQRWRSRHAISQHTIKLSTFSSVNQKFY